MSWMRASSSSNTNAVVVPLPSDIRLGLTEMSENDIGNQYFNYLINAKVKEFIESEGGDFQSLVNELVSELRSMGVRFLQQEEIGWELAGDDVVYTIVRQSISDAAVVYDPGAAANLPVSGNKVVAPLPADVVFSKASTDHVGNVAFQNLVRLHSQWPAHSSKEEALVVNFLMARTRAVGGRFLVDDDDADRPGLVQVATREQAYANVTRLLRYYRVIALHSNERRTAPPPLMEIPWGPVEEVDRNYIAKAKIDSLCHGSDKSKRTAMHSKLMQQKSVEMPMLAGYSRNVEAVEVHRTKNLASSVGDVSLQGTLASSAESPDTGMNSMHSPPGNDEGDKSNVPRRGKRTITPYSRVSLRTAVGQDSAEHEDHSTHQHAPHQGLATRVPSASLETNPLPKRTLFAGRVVFGDNVPTEIFNFDVHTSFVESIEQKIKYFEGHNISLTDKIIEDLATSVVEQHISGGGTFAMFYENHLFDKVTKPNAVTLVKAILIDAIVETETSGNSTKVSFQLKRILSVGQENWSAPPMSALKRQKQESNVKETLPPSFQPSRGPTTAQRHQLQSGPEACLTGPNRTPFPNPATNTNNVTNTVRPVETTTASSKVVAPVVHQTPLEVQQFARDSVKLRNMPVYQDNENVMRKANGQEHQNNQQEGDYSLLKKQQHQDVMKHHKMLDQVSHGKNSESHSPSEQMGNTLAMPQRVQLGYEHQDIGMHTPVSELSTIVLQMSSILQKLASASAGQSRLEMQKMKQELLTLLKVCKSKINPVIVPDLEKEQIENISPLSDDDNGSGVVSSMNGRGKWQFFPLTRPINVAHYCVNSDWRLVLIPLDGQAEDPIQLLPGQFEYLIH